MSPELKLVLVQQKLDAYDASEKRAAFELADLMLRAGTPEAVKPMEPETPRKDLPRAEKLARRVGSAAKCKAEMHEFREELMRESGWLKSKWKVA